MYGDAGWFAATHRASAICWAPQDPPVIAIANPPCTSYTVPGAGEPALIFSGEKSNEAVRAGPPIDAERFVSAEFGILFSQDKSPLNARRTLEIVTYSL